MASPVIEFRSSTTPFPTLASLPLAGTGFSGAIPAGSNSTVVPVRIYNNFLGAGGIGDATSCVLAAYDDTTHQGQGTSPAVIGQYLQVQVTDYNGVTTASDTTYYGIGGVTKHAIPVNSGTLAGAGTNYISLNVKAVVPANATQGSVSEGLWLEYSSTS